VLAQHRASRLIAYLSTPDRSREERLLALGRALADPKRVEILALVGRGVGRAAELVDATGLTRSTVHHHLAQLRAAGLIALEGNARAYTYIPRREAASDAAALVAAIIGTEGE
jgi:DNA-binding transcriptional ArsR family regulator